MKLVLNILYYGLGAVVFIFVMYIGFQAEFEIKKMAVKEAMKEMDKAE